VVISRLKFWLLLAVLLACGAAWSTWQWYQGRYPAWREEVQLSDGRVIVVKQKHEVYENYGTNQSWVTFALPEMGGEQTWHSYLKPMRVDVHDGKVYVFGRPRGPRQFEYYRYPKHYLVSFVWTGSTFNRIPVAQVPESLRRDENIYPCVPNLPLSLLSRAEKDNRWCPSQGENNQFGRRIDQVAYDELAISMARLSGGPPISE
jgi:hypothetical protein